VSSDFTVCRPPRLVSCSVPAARVGRIDRSHSPIGRNEEAESLFRRALALFRKALGPEHPRVLTCLEAFDRYECTDRSRDWPLARAAMTAYD
jgi:hypothetical protein